MSLGWILIGFFIFVTLLFAALAFFLPEWVGITGIGPQDHDIKKERQEHQEDPV